MKIILKDASGKYHHLVTLMPQHLQIKKRIKDTFEYCADESGLELAPTMKVKHSLLMECLAHVQLEVNEQIKSEYFNIVRLLTVIDDLATEFSEGLQNELSRAFKSEAIRYLLTQYDLTGEHYTSIDYGRLDLYPAYPVTGGIKQHVQRNDIHVTAELMGVSMGNFYPYNYEYLKFGFYAQLKEALYPDSDIHNAEYIEQEKYIIGVQKGRRATVQTVEEQSSASCCFF